MRYSGEQKLEREVWIFDLAISYHQSFIYLDYYYAQTKESKHHRSWKIQTKWSRLLGRDNTISSPPMPDSVEAEMRSFYQKHIEVIAIHY